jgi:DNA repair photolyase
VQINEVEAKSILRKYKIVDSWFISCYGMNLYRGCTHNCVYCDGRAEKYNVDGVFGHDISVKINAPDVLKRELNPERKRKPFKKTYILLGGGVCDGYQPAEKKYQLSRKALEVIYSFGFPVHLLTKSILIKKDIDIIQKINKKNGAIVSFSFSSVNKNISSVFEPGVPTPEERLKAITFFKSHDIPSGAFLMPVIPFISDTKEILDESVRKIKEAGADFIIFGSMTLKDGRQKEYFSKTIKEKYPELLNRFDNIYKYNKWGGANSEYIDSLHYLLHHICRKHKMPVRIPRRLFENILDQNDYVSVILSHIDYMLKIRGCKSPYSYAAYSVSKVKEPLSDIKNGLLNLKGVGRATEKIILEILETGTSRLYESLIGFKEHQ